jgi:hypothetical protein
MMLRAPKSKAPRGIATRRGAIAMAAILAPAILASLILAACAANKPPPEIPDIPLSAYTAFELPPVVNQSGQPAGAEAAQTIGEGIAIELKNRGYNIVASAPPESDPLLIKCELTAYQPNTSGNNGTTGITLKVTFIDMKNGHVRGEFEDAQNVQGGGLQSDRDILLGFAKGAGIQIDSRIKA